ncbi:hypothetical protein AVP43_02094 [Geobacillus stearothermophilus]|nr:hypothetical protein GLN3_12680 [Geobacillus lituanicus]KZE96013.1 hypothetical protein AVP43_02094 [Geobacillus stearothermophilus]KZM56713.1 hypothetical protein A3Q36_05255 [Geobacillus stearothermophilus]
MTIEKEAVRSDILFYLCIKTAGLVQNGTKGISCKARERAMAEKRKREKVKHTLTSAQEVSYARDFKMADQAGGYTAKKARH